MVAGFGSRPMGEAAAGPPEGSPKAAAKEPPAPPGSTAQEKPAAAGEKAITNSIGIELLLIRPGEFLMGSPDSDKDAHGHERPRHQVRITKAFYLGKYPVTQGQYQRLMGKNPSWFSKSGKGKGKTGKEDTSQAPVENVSWNDAVEFCKRLSEKEKREYRLPTEAQWEYACRAGSQTRWCFGDEKAGLGEYGWFEGNSGRRTHPVGQKKPNAWGLYDMHGNVWEWCRDWWGKDYYPKSPADDPPGPQAGARRVLRGGCWYIHAAHCRSAERFSFPPEIRGNCQGLRVSLAPAAK
jgi:formylglycine-generating enzyme required for sulfatase activity